MDLFTVDLDLFGHFRAHHRREITEVKEALFARIKMSHQRRHLSLTHLHLQRTHLLFEISIADESIIILIEVSKDLMHLNRAIEDFILYLPNKLFHPWVVDLALLDIKEIEVVVGLDGRWVGPDTVVEFGGHEVVIGENKATYLFPVR